MEKGQWTQNLGGSSRWSEVGGREKDRELGTQYTEDKICAVYPLFAVPCTRGSGMWFSRTTLSTEAKQKFE